MKDDSGTKKWYVFDLETNGLYDEVTTIHCLVLHDLNRDQTFTYGPDSIAAGLEHLATADVLIGQNILFFDIPVIRKLYSFYTFAVLVLLTHSLQHDSSGLRKNFMTWTQNNIRRFHRSCVVQHPSKHGAIAYQITRLALKTSKNTAKRCWHTASKMLMSLRNYLSTRKNKHVRRRHLNWNMILLWQLKNKLGQVFLLMWMHVLIWWMISEQSKQRSKLSLKELFPPKKIETVFVPKVNNAGRGYVKGQPFTKVMHEEFNPGSRQQIVDRLQTKYGWVPEKSTEKGNPILDDDVLSALPYPEAKPLAEYMLIKKRLGQIADGNNAWLKLVNDETGCMHGDVVTNGCITGRCAHRNPNMGQVPAGYSEYGKECRGLFHAPDGWTLIGVDAKALELRCLAGYLAHWDGGEYARVVTDESIDIHTYNQEMFGVATRDIAKRLLYGLLYGCGALKAGTIIDPNEKDELVLRKLGSTAINSFMQGIPALKELKNRIAHNIAKREYLIGLDGRPLFCRSDFKGLNVLLQSSGASL
jgi:DNA polymerase I